MDHTCLKCENREYCVTPCKIVNDLLWDDNRVMERHFEDIIVCYPQHREVHFSELKKHVLDKFSEDDVIQWSSGDARLKKTAVFIERFFNNVPCKALAERYGVKENTIVCIYKQAVESLEKIIAALDSRKEGIKATKAGKFTDDQKMFLLTSVFGFSGVEVGEMFNMDHKRVSMKVKRLSDKYDAAFKRLEVKEETPIDDPAIKGKLTRADVVAMVDAYVDQGLSQRQAFKRIAGRYAEVVGRPVSFRGIESRYYKATGEKKPKKSAYAGLSVSEISERMSL